MFAVNLFKTKEGGILTDGPGKTIPADAQRLGAWRRTRGALPLLGLFTAASSVVTAGEHSLTSILSESNVSFGSGTRAASKVLDTCLTAANTMPNNATVKIERIKVRLCAEDGDTQPETDPVRLRQWGHAAILMLEIDGIALPIAPLYRCLDSHNIVMIDDNTATGTTKVHAALHNGAGQGYDLGDPIVIPPGAIFRLYLLIPQGVSVATAGAAVKVPVRAYLEGTVYRQMSGAA